jgi:Zn-finger nucleic acid-binding protein
MEKLVACPVCKAEIELTEATEESEIVYCWDCASRLVAIGVEQNKITLNQAPAPEEEF